MNALAAFAIAALVTVMLPAMLISCAPLSMIEDSTGRGRAPGLREEEGISV